MSMYSWWFAVSYRLLTPLVCVRLFRDSYVAVTGLPNPNERHALVMARFAGACIAKFSELTKMLEHSLGPDTGDLGMRIGLNRYVQEVPNDAESMVCI